MPRLWIDIRYGWRAYSRTPGVTLVAILAIALGIGANTALFSYASALFLRPLAAAEPDRLVSLFHAGMTGGYSSFSYPDYVDLRDQNDVLSGLAAWSTIDLDIGRPAAERITGQIVSGNYFDVLGIAAIEGRVFHIDEDRTPDTHPVAVISYALWRRRYRLDPDTIGLSIPLNGRDFTIVGVAPEMFRGLELTSDPLVWVPVMMHRTAMPAFRAFGTELFGNRGTHWLDLTGRLKRGVSRDQANAALRVIADRQSAANPDTNKDWTIATIPAQDGRLGPPVTRDVVRLTWLLLAVVGLVLVIVCANVANLLLARAVARQKEIGVRLAIGAARGHVIQQMLTESVLLATMGGAAGIGLAAVAMALLPSIDVTASLPGLDPHLDVRVLVFAVVLTSLTGLAFGFAPALLASSIGVVAALKPGTPAAAGSRRSPLRYALVVVQVAMCMVLLTGAGLMLRTLLNLRSLPLGFDPSHLWIATVDLTQKGLTSETGGPLQAELLDRAHALPGAIGVSLGFITPFSGRRMANDIFWIPPGGGEQRRRDNVDMNVVGPEYFSVMKIPLLRGRSFADGDRSGAMDVAIVNRAMADRLWPGADAIGQHVWSWNPRGSDRELVVVGVVENGRYYRSWRSEARSFLFVPAGQWYQGNMALHVRGAGLGANDLRHAIGAITPDVPAPTIVRATDAMAGAMALEQTGTRLLAAFGLIALAIAGIGIYSAVAFTAGERTTEIGIRMALGARRSAVLGSVILTALKPLLVGVAIGWLAAIGLTRLIATLLFDVRPGDPATYAMVGVTLIGAGVAASYVPARRATKADPLQALRAG